MSEKKEMCGVCGFEIVPQIDSYGNRFYDGQTVYPQDADPVTCHTECMGPGPKQLWARIKALETAVYGLTRTDPVEEGG